MSISYFKHNPNINRSKILSPTDTETIETFLDSIESRLNNDVFEFKDLDQNLDKQQLGWNLNRDQDDDVDKNSEIVIKTIPKITNNTSMSTNTIFARSYDKNKRNRYNTLHNIQHNTSHNICDIIDEHKLNYINIDDTKYESKLKSEGSMIAILQLIYDAQTHPN